MTTRKKKVKSPDKDSLLFSNDIVMLVRFGDKGLDNMNDKVLLTIVSALDSYEEPVRLDLPKHERERIIFSKWALEEILDLVWEHPWTLASETVCKFAVLMRNYSEVSVTDEQKRIFSIAADTANDFMEVIDGIESSVL